MILSDKDKDEDQDKDNWTDLGGNVHKKVFHLKTKAKAATKEKPVRILYLASLIACPLPAFSAIVFYGMATE